MDIVKHNKERLAKKEAVRQYREELKEQNSKRQYKPAYYQGYNASLGKHQIQTLGDSTTSANRIITNGAIPRGLAVNFADGFLDAMPRVTSVVKATTTKTAPNIKYVYLTGGSSISKTALCVAGYKSGWTIQIDEWNNSEYILINATIDNLGGSNFILSYTLKPVVTTNDWVFKVARNSSIIFTYNLPSRYTYELGNYTSYQKLNYTTLGFDNVGYGNWINNAVFDTVTATPTSVVGIIKGLNTFRLSATELNPNVASSLSINPYDINNSPAGYNAASNYCESDNTFFAPETERYGSNKLFYQSPGSPIFLVTSIQRETWGTFRYNAITGKTIATSLRGDWVRTDYTGGSSSYTGFFNDGYLLRTSGTSNIQEIIFRNAITNQNQSVSSDYACTTAVTEGSPVAVVTSGVVPPVGTMVVSGSFGYGAIVQSVSGNSITLDRPSFETTDLPDIPTSLYWGFSGGSPSKESGWSIALDLLKGGISNFPISHLTRNDPSTAKPQILNASTDVYVAMYGDDLRPNGYKKITAYPPITISPGSSSILGTDNFRVFHASYSSS